VEAELNRLRVTLFPETKTAEYTFPSDVLRPREDAAADGVGGDGGGPEPEMRCGIASGELVFVVNTGTVTMLTSKVLNHDAWCGWGLGALVAPHVLVPQDAEECGPRSSRNINFYVLVAVGKGTQQQQQQQQQQ